MSDALHSPMGLLLFDLRLVAVFGAALLYALWFVVPGPSVAGLARVSVVVAALASGLIVGLGGGAGSLREILTTSVLGVYLAFGYWARVSGLGFVVAAVAGGLVAWPMWAPAGWGLGRAALVAPASLVNYWLAIEYWLGAVGVALLLMAFSAGAVLNLVSDRWRASPFAPVDLKFVSHAGAQWAFSVLTLATVAAGVAWAQRGLVLDVEWLRTVAIVGLWVLAGLWLFWGRSGLARDGQLQVLWLLFLLLLGILVVGPSGLEHLTRPTSAS